MMMMTMEGMMDNNVLDDVIRRLLEGKGAKQVQLSESEIRQLCVNARQIFLSNPILLDLSAPIRVCGDIHGQYQDLLRVFEYGGYPPAANYLFLGDYVDRGKQSLETICLLLAYKIRYPDKIHLLRGNHEDAKINRIYGFYDECKRRFNVRLWKIFTDCFNCLPVAALIDGKILCMHGGLSPELQNLNQIKEIQRPTEIPDNGLLCDLLWSDPDSSIDGWADSDRGVSCNFGSDAVTEFLDKNDLDLICRGHQVVEDGYEFFAKRRLVTIFSAPNYGGEFDNAGALLSVDESLVCSFEILKPIDRGSSSKMNLKKYQDLLRVFEYGGYPPAANYLFLGDYVDRGKQSLETICLLLAYKIRYPDKIHLLRGNHEDAKINRIYGFYDECKRRFNVRLWKIFTDCFNCLPVAALIDGKILCMHGGLSPELQNLNQIKEIQRPTEIPDNGLLCDLLWSDPDSSIDGWADSDRGVSCNFGSDAVTEFLDKNDLDLICRGHQVVEDGYEFFAKRRLVTIFSAPNYGGEFDNAGALLSVDESLVCSFEILKPIDRGSSSKMNLKKPPKLGKV
ncbi:hypothetical protein TanjilG_21482 [Lupinus angustifolius]|uniref:Serine/threonine-protein phosphatase n=1 Tax=Lupinus angustifolius TaxID=3871 RepID=A0A4P1QUB6_LUPAN|nr:hypothetical protein TanjilG_21482 [Lupinus angustifolius]